jgi:actin related protein 2/3 complex subunit 2
MLHIPSDNLLLKKTLEELFETPTAVDRIVSDFDYTTYHLTTPEDKTRLLISIQSRAFKDLQKYGALDKLKSVYGAYEAPTTEPGYDYSLYLDLTSITGKQQQKQLIEEIALLKRNMLAAPFDAAFAEYEQLSAKFQETGVEPDTRSGVYEIDYRDEEAIYIQPSFDRVTVIFSTIFKDETDKIFGKVFLQEFVDARRRAVQNAPQVLYSHKEPPLEVRDLIRYSPDEKKGYVTFVLFPRHLVPQKRENTISHIQLFRNYFHYHIKCSKAYMHSRMRFRVNQYLKVLNRAKPESDETVERKTATGRRFQER